MLSLFAFRHNAPASEHSNLSRHRSRCRVAESTLSCPFTHRVTFRQHGMPADECKLPPWTLEILRCPRNGQPLRLKACRLIDENGHEVALIEENVIRFPVRIADDSISFHRNIGGSRFFERSATPFAMSS